MRIRMCRYAYYAEVAGLHYSIINSREGLELSVAGFSHKLHVLAAKVAERIVRAYAPHP